MKIIFLKDVPRIGRAYEVKEVADGYGRHLVSQKVAELATKESLARIESKNLARAALKKGEEALLNKVLVTLNGAEITLHGNASEKGHLFSGIHKKEILSEIKRVYGLDFHPDYLVLDKPLKEIGTFEAPIVAGQGRAILKVVVERQ